MFFVLHVCLFTEHFACTSQLPLALYRWMKEAAAVLAVLFLRKYMSTSQHLHHVTDKIPCD